MYLGCRIMGSFIDLVNLAGPHIWNMFLALCASCLAFQVQFVPGRVLCLAAAQNVFLFSNVTFFYFYSNLSFYSVLFRAEWLLPNCCGSCPPSRLISSGPRTALMTSLTNTLSMIILHLPIDTHFLAPVYQAVAQSPSIFPGMSYSLNTP